MAHDYVCTFVIAALISGTASVCPSDWQENAGKCYMFSEFKGITIRPWHEAQSYCETQRGNLVVIETAEENQYLSSRMTRGFWMGLHDLNEYDSWEWVDGTTLTYENWKPGQPDHWDNAPGATEDCIAMLSGDDSGMWNDQSCSLFVEFVCERPNDLAEIPMCAIENGWEQYNDKCYNFVSNSVVWTTANDNCKEMGGDLVAITSANEQNIVSLMINSKNENAWIGLSNLNHETGGLYWSNEVDIYSTSSSSYKNWAEGEPSASRYSSCVQVLPDAANNSPWSTDRCGEEHSYICESGLTGSCADGWRLHGGSCYLFVMAENAWGTWVDARDNCAAMGGNALVIESEAEQQYISEKLPEFVDAGSNEFWIGISDSAEDGVWRWEDDQNSLVSSGDWINWNKNQPMDRKDAWDCVQIYTGFYLGRWETDDCFKKQAYVCEIQPGLTPKPLVPIANTHRGCDPGWLWFGDFCYYWNYDKMVQWDTAESKCQEMNAHLASVLSGEENSFIIDHLSASTWIGGSTAIDISKFQWSDNSPWGFTDWAENEPNSGGGQGCAQLFESAGYKWDDDYCTDVKNYVCKKAEQDCWEPLGMEDGTILNPEITASSEYNQYHAAYLGRLNNDVDGSYTGAWASSGEDLATPGDAWLQIHLIPKRTVAGLTTQGRPKDHDQYVKTYKVAYSNDGVSFSFIKDRSGGDMNFTGNVDMNSKVTNRFPTSVSTSYLRIYPWSFYVHISMRVELLGCTADGDVLPTPSPQTECTSVSYENRLDCGYGGVTEKECKSKGCCYDKTVPNVKWCFYKAGDYDTRCGKDWVYDPSGEFICYHFNPYKIRDRNDAQLYCYAMGGDLLSINSKHEQSYVTAQVTSLVSASALWIGANKLDPEAGWQWSNGQPFQYFNWRNGEPNNWTGEEDCVELYTSDGTWNDNPCYYQRGIACKKFTAAAPQTANNGKFTVNVCEGDKELLACPGNDVIIIHHASYGRTNIAVCNNNGDPVPVGGCQSNDALQIVSNMCNNEQTCEIEATNAVFGDPCAGVYKYLNIIYSCDSLTCFEPLGVENGTVGDQLISESSSLDGSHRGVNGRLNSATSWATNEGTGAWIQVLLDQHKRISGLLMQGAKDADRWVKTFKIAYAKDETNSDWIEYNDYDDNVAVFQGSKDRNTIKQVAFAERVYTTGIRIYPLTWNGDLIGMRLEVTGCNPFLELTCFTLGDAVYTTDDVDGTVINADCPGFCPEVLAYQYNIYGDKTYSGNSQICSAAIHAGVILDRLGGPVSIVKQPGQSSYEGTERNGIHSQDLDRYTPIAFSFSNPEKNCPSGWIPYGEYCYFLEVENAVTWPTAEAYCESLDSNLVSIYNAIDQDFIWQTHFLSGAEEMWIGFNDIRSVNEYEWTDGSYVTFTHWDVNQPTGRTSSCVYMSAATGRWKDGTCENPYSFMCKKFKGYYQHDDGFTPTPPPGCPAGWVPYSESCYLFSREHKTYDEAMVKCSDEGGIPADILDKYVQSFLHTVIGAEDYRWWIGLVATPGVGGTEWAWESGYPLNEYDNWARGNPDVTNGECSVFYGGQYGTGMWYSYVCNNDAYTICQKSREGWTPAPKTTLPPSGGCPGSWDTPDENSGFCYRVYSPEATDNNNQPVGWSNAYHQCLATGGDLLSIHDADEDVYIVNLVKQSLKGDSQGLWIGLNNKNTISETLESGWEWTDMSPVNFLSWTLGSPSQPRENNCVELRYEGSLGIAAWQNIDCDEKRDWICKLKKGIDEVIPTEPPTGKPNGQCGLASDGTWLEFEGWCYLFNDEVITSWHAAQSICMATGADLTSVHTINEQSFIANQIKNMNGTIRFWIGLREHGGVDGEYTWTDETPVDYVKWNAGEPNDAMGMEQCVLIIEPNARWNDANCGIENAGYICRKRIGDPPKVPPPTPSWPGGCQSGWLMYDNYCYQVHGEFEVCAPDTEDWSDGTCRASFTDAHQQCLDADADLVTIHNKYENAFLTAHIYRVPVDLWIGLNDAQWGYKYIWSSGEEVTYTNWYAGEPNHWNGEEYCAEMYQRENIAGRWNDNKCSNVMSYICQKDKDPSLGVGQELNSNRNCPSGWLQYDTVNGNYICYYLDTTPRSFDDARTNCQSIQGGADLVSFQTMYEQAIVTSFVKDTTAWIGLSYDPESYSWLWVDQWPVWISNWGEYEPGSDMDKLCTINKDSILGSEWITANCNQQYPSICRWTTENVPPTPPTIDGSCPDDDWREYGGFCFKAFKMDGEPTKGLQWSDAEAQCVSLFGHLTSITSRSQTEWINSWTNTSESLWIGLRDNGQGGWAWIDNRPVSYTYWSANEPNDIGENGEDCVEVYPDGKWNDNECMKLQGYLCEVPKAIGTDENGDIIHYQTAAPPTESNAAVIVGAVLGSIAALLLIGGIAFYYYRNGGFGISKSDGTESGFDNTLYTTKDSTDGKATLDVPGLSDA